MKQKIAILVFMFTLLIATNTTSNNQPATLKQYNAAVNATQTAFPINDMYGVKKRVVQSQNQYQKAREAQAKQAQQYQNMIK